MSFGIAMAAAALVALSAATNGPSVPAGAADAELAKSWSTQPSGSTERQDDVHLSLPDPADGEGRAEARGRVVQRSRLLQAAMSNDALHAMALDLGGGDLELSGLAGVQVGPGQETLRRAQGEREGDVDIGPL